MVTLGKLAESLVCIPRVLPKPEIQLMSFPLLLSSGPQSLLATMRHSSVGEVLHCTLRPASASPVPL